MSRRKRPVRVPPIPLLQVQRAMRADPARAEEQVRLILRMPAIHALARALEVPRPRASMVRLAFEVCGLVGSPIDARTVVLGNLGVSSLEEAKRAIELLREADGEGDDSLATRAVDFLAGYAARNPRRWSETLLPRLLQAAPDATHGAVERRLD